MQKLLAVASLFAGVMLSVAVTASVAIQREGTTGPGIAAFLGIAVLAGLVLGTGSWFLMPRAVPGRSTTGDPIAPVEVAEGERVVWVGHARFATFAIAALVATVVLLSGVVAFAVAATGFWPLAIVPVVLALALLGSASWTVRVDAAGLTVRSALGWPMYRVTVADLASAGVATVVPFGEFGGYGIRWGLGRRLGIITRGGEALEVQRHDGRAVVVTVDDAATAAGLLRAYAAKS
jgi:hypothetical protein